MCSGTGTRALPRVGYPIRKSPDRRLFSTYPRLIAAVHVLLRLLAPRHPPPALNILTRRTPLPAMQFSRFAPAYRHRSPARTSLEKSAVRPTKLSLRAPSSSGSLRLRRSRHRSAPMKMPRPQPGELGLDDADGSEPGRRTVRRHPWLPSRSVTGSSKLRPVTALRTTTDRGGKAQEEVQPAEVRTVPAVD